MSGCFCPDRRKVLELGIYLAVGSNTGMIIDCLIPTCCYEDEDKGARWQQKHFKNRESFVAVGQRYLRGAPEEMRLDLLVKRLLPTVAERKTHRSYESDISFYETLQIQIKDDFRNKRMVNVDGWRLSVTEARFCGLIALT